MTTQEVSRRGVKSMRREACCTYIRSRAAAHLTENPSVFSAVVAVLLQYAHLAEDPSPRRRYVRTPGGRP